MNIHPDYTPGNLDRTAPEKIWLQIDTEGDNSARDEPWPGADVVTWQDESIGGLEIQYVRADLVSARVPDGWQLVPRDVLENVVDDARRFINSDAGWEVYGTGRDEQIAQNAAMLAAAAKPDAQGDRRG